MPCARYYWARLRLLAAYKNYLYQS
uniref:Uncharacterized protein n=1 Tax=Rhizophora mucronata TaxID=61149 RepID=A0A2P2JQ73_RHIMU